MTARQPISVAECMSEIRAAGDEMRRCAAVLGEPFVIPYRGAIIRLERSEKGYTCDAGSEWAARQIGYAFSNYWFDTAPAELIWRKTEQQGEVWRASFDVYMGDKA